MISHNICFYGEITKIIPKLSSNTLHICSAGYAQESALIQESGYATCMPVSTGNEIGTAF